MVARQLPKLKTRVRFPSPAPEIQPVLYRFNLWHVAAEENPVKRVRNQVDFHKCNAVKSLRVARRHNVSRDSFRPHQKQNRPERRLYFLIIIKYQIYEYF